MRCRDFESRLNAALDERQSPPLDGELARHAAHCAPCRQRLTACELLFDGLGQVELERQASLAAVSPADLTERVLAQINAKSVARRWPVWESIALFAASAAAALLAVWGLTSPAGPQRSIVAPTAQHLPLAADLPAMLAKADLRSPEVLNRAKVTGESLAVVVMGIPPLGAGFYAPPDVGIFPDEAPAWMDPVTEGLHPLKSSVDGALQVLRGAMPYAGLNSRS